MKIARLDVFVIGDGPETDPDKGGIEPLACLQVHLAAYSPVTPFIEFAPAEVFESPLRRELQNAGFPVKNGAIALPERPGIGYELPAELVRAFRIA